MITTLSAAAASFHMDRCRSPSVNIGRGQWRLHIPPDNIIMPDAYGSHICVFDDRRPMLLLDTILLVLCMLRLLTLTLTARLDASRVWPDSRSMTRRTEWLTCRDADRRIG